MMFFIIFNRSSSPSFCFCWSALVVVVIHLLIIILRYFIFFLICEPAVFTCDLVTCVLPWGRTFLSVWFIGANLLKYLSSCPTSRRYQNWVTFKIKNLSIILQNIGQQNNITKQLNQKQLGILYLIFDSLTVV